MSTWNGIGTKYLGFSRKQSDGSHHATEWFVVNYLPVVPLRRYRLVVGRTNHTPGSTGGSTSTTEYHVLGRTRLRVLEVLATYLTWWVAGPALVLSPFLLMAWANPDFGRGSSFWSGVVVIGGLTWVVGLPIVLISASRRWRELPAG
ncbi:hypothetical protein [Streptomyces sp. NBC_01565]|uniref:hypothetical protein n=1 Tax=unclassified Streptomyces TaxID=2593676 RepID=UPI002250B7F0|nr:hypothetical protein [Streptomyces sp. NBC_01565]MCX4546107.1 hypothetical protein [Streptomyces sp. NBC_01565]